MGTIYTCILQFLKVYTIIELYDVKTASYHLHFCYTAQLYSYVAHAYVYNRISYICFVAAFQLALMISIGSNLNGKINIFSVHYIFTYNLVLVNQYKVLAHPSLVDPDIYKLGVDPEIYIATCSYTIHNG